MRATSSAAARRSNFQDGISVVKEIPPVERRISFRDLAKMAWPTKTEFELARLTGADPRTCQRWLADDTEPPADAAMHVINEITRLYLTRPR